MSNKWNQLYKSSFGFNNSKTSSLPDLLTLNDNQNNTINAPSPTSSPRSPLGTPQSSPPSTPHGESSADSSLCNSSANSSSATTTPMPNIPPPPTSLPPPLPNNTITGSPTVNPERVITRSNAHKSKPVISIPIASKVSTSTSTSTSFESTAPVEQLPTNRRQLRKNREKVQTVRDVDWSTVSVTEYKRIQLVASRLIVFWVEDYSDFNIDLFIKKEPEAIYFIIIPLTSGLYAIYQKSTSKVPVGIFVEYMLLPKHQLGSQIRRFISIAQCWLLSPHENGYLREPHFLTRYNKIQGTLRSFSNEFEMKHFYSNQFSKPDTKIFSTSNNNVNNTPTEAIIGDFNFNFKHLNIPNLLNVENTKKSNIIQIPKGNKSKEKKTAREESGKKTVRWSKSGSISTSSPSTNTTLHIPPIQTNRSPNGQKKPKNSARQKTSRSVSKDKESKSSTTQQTTTPACNTAGGSITQSISTGEKQQDKQIPLPPPPPPQQSQPQQPQPTKSSEKKKDRDSKKGLGKFKGILF